MHSRKWTRYVITLLFLLTFFQQIGAGLFIHNLLHDGQETEQSEDKPGTKKGISFSCSCVDDFLAPFESGDSAPALTPPLAFSAKRQSYKDSLQAHFFTFILLRGPPAQVV